MPQIPTIWHQRGWALVKVCRVASSGRRGEATEGGKGGRFSRCLFKLLRSLGWMIQVLLVVFSRGNHLLICFNLIKVFIYLYIFIHATKFWLYLFYIRKTCMKEINRRQVSRGSAFALCFIPLRDAGHDLGKVPRAYLSPGVAQEAHWR